jgi:hypothetical protein
MSQIRIFLDTNILVYAHDSLSQYHTDSANLLTMVVANAKTFDLRLAAVALSTQINYLITYNTKDFTEIDGLTTLLPQEVFSL